MAAATHTIAGTVLTMPVRVRKADVHTAMFSVPADAAQRLIDYSGLEVCRFRPDRAVVTLILARYLDGDLGRYHEFGTCVMVNPVGSQRHGCVRWPTRRPSSITFRSTRRSPQAGRTIWGFPKIMADFAVRDSNPFSFEVSEGGR